MIVGSCSLNNLMGLPVLENVITPTTVARRKEHGQKGQKYLIGIQTCTNPLFDPSR